MVISGVFDKAFKWLKLLVPSDVLPRRDLAPGFQREGIPIWGVLTAFLIVYQLLNGI